MKTHTIALVAIGALLCAGMLLGFDAAHAHVLHSVPHILAAGAIMPVSGLAPRRRGIVKVRADGDSLASVLTKIDGLTKTIEASAKDTVKAADLVPLQQTIAAQKTQIDNLTTALDQTSQQLAGLKLNPYGTYSRAHKVHKKLKAFTGERADDRAYAAGMWLAAAVWGNPVAAQWCKEHDLGLVEDKSEDKVAIKGKVDPKVFAAASENQNTAGGFIVPSELERTIIDLREDYGTARRLARIYTMGSDTLRIPRRSTGLQAYFVADRTTATESQKGWDGVELVAKKAAVLTRFPSELQEDAIINVADDLVQEIAYAFAVLEDSCFWNGDGSPTYGGIQGVRVKIVGKKGGVVAASGHDTFAEFDLTDLESVMGALPLYAFRTARWMMSVPFYNLVINRLGYAASGNTVETIQGSGGLRKLALGFPVEWDQTLPTAGTASDDYSNLPVAFFGEPSLAVAMGSRRGITVRQSTDRYFDTDEIGILGTERFDLVAHGLGDSTTAGPLVALVGQ